MSESPPGQWVADHHSEFYRKPSYSPFIIINRTSQQSLQRKPNLQRNTYILICFKLAQSHRLFDQMPQRLLQASITSKIIHAQSLKFGFGSKGQLGNSIVDLYDKCGNVDFVEKMFDRFTSRDVLAWNSVMSMYSRCGLLEQVAQSFGALQNYGVLLNQFTFAILLSTCARLMDVGFGKQIHCNVIKMGFELNSFCGGYLIDMYAKCRNVGFGKQIHCNVIKMGFELNSFCGGSLIDMYAKCRNVVDARWIFDRAMDPDTVSWTAMIGGYIQIGLPEEALKLFEAMQKLSHVPDQVAFVTVISACVSLGRLDDAYNLFLQMP